MLVKFARQILTDRGASVCEAAAAAAPRSAHHTVCRPADVPSQQAGSLTAQTYHVWK